jgi:hypothetical protein
MPRVLPALQHVTQLVPLVQALLIVGGIEMRIEDILLLGVFLAITFKRNKCLK